ncbi:hypothetical protein [Aminobacter sp. Piv2-1]|uniref:hypothetical protein n=1 Tax=Aminobacter sp. Piv2-1 TaxID=3031122 RepID=UPI0030AA01E5
MDFFMSFLPRNVGFAAGLDARRHRYARKAATLLAWRLLKEKSQDAAGPNIVHAD